MTKREQADQMKEEVLDVLKLWFDKVDNRSQIIEMLTEGGEAGYAGYKVFGTFSQKDSMKAGMSLGLYIAKYFEEGLLTYSDETEETGV